MPVAIPTAGGYASPSTTSIFLQPPGVGFVALLLTQVNIPSPTRVALHTADSEVWTRSWTIVRNPVQAVTAQQRLQNPDTLQVTGTLSANPLLGPLAQVGLLRLDKLELQKLRTILQANLSFVVTPDRTLANMSCVRMVEQYGEESQGVRLTLDFQEMVFAIPGVAPPQLDLDALGLGAGAGANLGPQTPTEVPDFGGLG